jgi:hypothetical protein
MIDTNPLEYIKYEQIRTNTNNNEQKNAEKMPIHNKSYPCHCGKIFKHASSLRNHKQKMPNYGGFD